MRVVHGIVFGGTQRRYAFLQSSGVNRILFPAQYQVFEHLFLCAVAVVRVTVILSLHRNLRFGIIFPCKSDKLVYRDGISVRRLIDAVNGVRVAEREICAGTAAKADQLLQRLLCGSAAAELRLISALGVQSLRIAVSASGKLRIAVCRRNIQQVIVS